METITLIADGEEITLEVLEQTTIAGVDYLLAADGTEEDDEAICYILRAVRTENDDVIYEFVDDDNELDYISRIFEELLEDTDIVAE